MAYCQNCGEPVRDEQDVCLSCGTHLRNSKKQVVEEGSTAGYGILGFFIPLVGLILYLLWQTDRPKAAKSAGKGALIGFILNIIVSVIFMVFYIIFLEELMYM
jgi:uncharacterized protein YqgC (DUF456 family)